MTKGYLYSYSTANWQHRLYLEQSLDYSPQQRRVTVNKMAGVTSRRALVVDDEAIIGDFCSRVLSVDGFEVDIASNGSIAPNMLQQKDYDLCLFDMRTPVMDGRELYQIIVSKYPRLANKVVFASGDVLDTHTQRLLQLTGRPYLAKPFNPR